MSDRTPRGQTPTRKYRGRGRGGSTPRSPASSGVENTSKDEIEKLNSQPDPGKDKKISSKMSDSGQSTTPTPSSTGNPTTPTPKSGGGSGSRISESDGNTTTSSLSDSVPFSSPQGNIGAITDPDSFATPPSAQNVDDVANVEVDLDQVFVGTTPSTSSQNPGRSGDPKIPNPATMESLETETGSAPPPASGPDVQEPSTSTSSASIAPKPEKPPRKISAEKGPPTPAIFEAEPNPQTVTGSRTKGQPPQTIEIEDNVQEVGGSIPSGESRGGSGESSSTSKKDAKSTSVSSEAKVPEGHRTSIVYGVKGYGRDDDPWSGSYPPDSKNTKRPSIIDIAAATVGFTGRQWSCLVLFGLANLFSAMVISLQAPFYPPEAERKGATASEYGLVFGIYELVVFLTSPIFGKYINKVGPRLIFNTGLMTTALSCIAFGFLDKIPGHVPFISLSFLFRILEALGASAFVTSSFAIIAVEFPESVATTFASLETFYGLGLIVGPSVGGLLFEVGGFILPFAVTGVCLLVIGIGASITMPKINRVTTTDGTDSGQSQGIFTILRVPGVALATLALVMTANSIGFLSATLEPHLRPFGLSPTQVGLVFIIYGGVYAIGAPIVGRICDRIQKSRQLYLILLGQVLIFVGFLFIGPAPFLTSLETSVWLTAVGLVILGQALASTLVAGFIFCLSEATSHGFPDNISTYGVISGLWTSAVSLGAFLGPSAGGFLYDNFAFRRGTYYIFGTEAVVVLLISLYILFPSKRSSSQSRGISGSGENEPLLRSISPILGENKEKAPQNLGVPDDPTVIVAGSSGGGGGSGYGTIGDSQA